MYQTYYVLKETPAATVNIDNWLDCLYNQAILNAPQYVNDSFSHTETKLRLAVPTPNIMPILSELETRIDTFNTEHGTEYDSMYSEFQIPKRTGGYRTIDAPNDALKTIQRDIADTFINKLHILYHDSCYSYTKKRCTRDAIAVHQRFKSNWFIKLDLKDFFPSTTAETVMNMFRQIYPFACVFDNPAAYTILAKIAALALYKGKLPQGTPLSPMLTNLIMVPFDHILSAIIGVQRGRYTRYADDLLISYRDNSKMDIEARTLGVVNQTLRTCQLPYQIKEEKTRVGSKAGANWNLGLMLNKDNNITLGHKRKQRLCAAINNFLRDFTNGNPWAIIDTQVLLGELSYLHSIEPDYEKFIIQRLEQKYNSNFQNDIKQILNN